MAWRWVTHVTESSNLPQWRLNHHAHCETISKLFQPLFNSILAISYRYTAESLTSFLPPSPNSLQLDYGGLDPAAVPDGQFVQLLKLCVTPICTQDASTYLLCRDSYCGSILIFLPSLTPRVGTHLPGPASCSPVWQGFSLLASRSLRDSSSAQKRTWRNTLACALASLPSVEMQKNIFKKISHEDTVMKKRMQQVLPHPRGQVKCVSFEKIR